MFANVNPQTSKIQFVNGDATAPLGEGNKIIVHVCNDIGKWGKGFVMALSRKWPDPEREYRSWHACSGELPLELGRIQLVEVEPNIWVANLIGQQGVRQNSNLSPVRYEAIQEGLRTVSVEAKRLRASVHMPRIGCGLAGGRWDKIEPIITQELLTKGIPVSVYDWTN